MSQDNEKYDELAAKVLADMVRYHAQRPWHQKMYDAIFNRSKFRKIIIRQAGILADALEEQQKLSGAMLAALRATENELSLIRFQAEKQKAQLQESAQKMIEWDKMITAFNAAQTRQRAEEARGLADLRGQLEKLAALIGTMQEHTSKKAREHDAKLHDMNSLIAQTANVSMRQIVALEEKNKDYKAGLLALAGRVNKVEVAVHEQSAEHSRRIDQMAQANQAASETLSDDVKRIDQLARTNKAASETLSEGLRRIDQLIQTNHAASETLSADLGKMKEVVGVFSPDEAQTFDEFYLHFEDRYRGSREVIRQRMEEYIPHLEKLTESFHVAKERIEVADLGCGRGEWLELLGEKGFIQARGVDANVRMVDICKKANLQVEMDNLFAFLSKYPSSSLHCVTSMHVVEHVPFVKLLAMLEEIKRVLKPGGLMILETPNCNNVLTATQNFPLDPTHNKLIPPLLLSFTAENAGFADVQTIPLHSYSPDYHVESQGNVAQRFNDYFYGAQDYALIARKT